MRVLHPRVTSGQLSDLARFLLRNFFFFFLLKIKIWGVCVCLCVFVLFLFLFSQKKSSGTHTKTKIPVQQERNTDRKKSAGSLNRKRKKVSRWFEVVFLEFCNRQKTGVNESSRRLSSLDRRGFSFFTRDHYSVNVFPPLHFR